MQKMAPRPPSTAALTLRATNCPIVSIDLKFVLKPRSPTSSVSFKITLRSLWPTRAQLILVSLSWSTLISPVKAPLGLSKTFWAATPIFSLVRSRVRVR